MVNRLESAQILLSLRWRSSLASSYPEISEELWGSKKADSFGALLGWNPCFFLGTTCFFCFNSWVLQNVYIIETVHIRFWGNDWLYIYIYLWYRIFLIFDICDLTLTTQRKRESDETGSRRPTTLWWNWSLYFREHYFQMFFFCWGHTYQTTTPTVWLKFVEFLGWSIKIVKFVHKYLAPMVAQNFLQGGPVEL